MATRIYGLIWDEWNKHHIARHGISVAEVEEVCHGNHRAVVSYRKRILIEGKTKRGKYLIIALSPEDRNLQPYGKGIYYPVTAFDKEVKE
ncbi:MAG: hypothetical protein Q8P32_01360 [Candidatus Komeilibacteria bacterium]|nr:hypothetical protein [Candidatus Komeilibacteria bacterium]